MGYIERNLRGGRFHKFDYEDALKFVENKNLKRPGNGDAVFESIRAHSYAEARMFEAVKLKKKVLAHFTKTANISINPLLDVGVRESQAYVLAELDRNIDVYKARRQVTNDALPMELQAIHD